MQLEATAEVFVGFGIAISPPSWHQFTDERLVQVSTAVAPVKIASVH